MKKPDIVEEFLKLHEESDRHEANGDLEKADKCLDEMDGLWEEMTREARARARLLMETK